MRQNKVVSEIKILNPKRIPGKSDNYFPYYAGFSSYFAKGILESLKHSSQFSILDPWNGSGTTTTSGFIHGYHSIGIDLNPVMVVVSKANLIDHNEIGCLWPITIDISNKSTKSSTLNCIDPLSLWFDATGVKSIRKLEAAIQELLINPVKYEPLISDTLINGLSSIASFFYVALFKCVRILLKPFKTSNPTWIKKSDSNTIISISLDELITLFKSNVKEMIAQSNNNLNNEIIHRGNVELRVGSSHNLYVNNNTIDLVLTSPPYCTRIDYAIATLPELAILGFSYDRIDNLRRLLIGTSTVPKILPNINAKWGETCNIFLNNIYNHYSKASKSYYFKNHIQYFNSIYISVQEISRVIKPNGTLILVVQDSYYKDIHNDLPQIFIEMCQNVNFSLKRKVDFKSEKSLSGINFRSIRYRHSTDTTESVICLSKN